MNNDIKLDAPLDPNAKYSLVPEDFPHPFHAGSIAGAQPKVLMVEYDGKLYLPGATPPERYNRWDICEDLAKQFGQKSLESK